MGDGEKGPARRASIIVSACRVFKWLIIGGVSLMIIHAPYPFLSNLRPVDFRLDGAPSIA